jgi:hypothetical protein
MAAPGKSVLTGWCIPNENDDGSAIEFDYPSLPVTVTTRFLMTVEPGTSVETATMLNVDLLGGVCPNSAASPQVALYSSSHKDVADGSGGPAPGRHWALEVPKGLVPGRYQLEADCILGRGAVFGTYAPLTLTVR